MLLRVAVVFLAAALGAAQGLPKTSAIVQSVTNYVAEYQQAFVSIVADESTIQRVSSGRGTSLRERRTEGELFSTILENGAWMSLHDIQTVDGRSVTDRLNVRALLTRESFASLAPRLTAANAKYNIGSVSRNFNEPTLALLLFTRAHVGDLSVDSGRVPGEPARSPLANLRIRLPDHAPLVRSPNSLVTTRATFVVEAGTGLVRSTSLSLNAGLVDAQLDTLYERDPRLDLWVPVTFDERYSHRPRRGQDVDEVTEVHTAFTNYRRFETSGRIVQ